MPSRSSLLRTFCIATSLAAILAIHLGAQSFYGSVVGTVTDQSNSAMEGASVTLTNNGTSQKLTAEAGSDGGYRFVNLVPGIYKIEVDRVGFKHYTRDQINVQVDAVIRIDTIMEVGEQSQKVEVTAATPLLQTENASLSQVVGGRAVQELPLNGRNILNLVSLVPGVVPQGLSDGSPTGKNVFAAGNYQIGGGTANQSAAYYDGVPTNITYGNLTALNPTQDSVSEFRVQTNNNTAEYGRYTGGVINVVSKSGTNEIHGSAYEFLRNRELNAGSFFSNKNGLPKPAFTQNQFGGNLSGPIKRDKIFMFGSYEGYRARQGVPFNLTVPTERMLSGDFSGFVNAAGAQIPIYDVLTQCGAYSNTGCTAAQLDGTQPQRQQFPGNRIPASRINPVAKRYISFPYWALPNVAGQQSGNILNYFTNARTGGNNNQLNLRGDYQVSEKQRLFARYTRLKSANLQVPLYDKVPLFTSDPYSPENYITTHAVLADTFILNPTTVFDLRAGFMYWDYDRRPGTQGIDIPAKLGLPSYFGDIPNLNGVAGSQTIPLLSIASPTVNAVATGRIIGFDTTYTLAPTLNMIKGRHSIKFGADLRRNSLNYYQNNASGGRFAFDNLFTSRNALNPGATGAGFASFLLGLSTNASNVQISPFTYTTIYYQGYYLSDTWQATNKLTVTAGLRWEIPGSYVERYDRQATFNPTELNPALKGVTVLGKQMVGAFDLVNTVNHPGRGLNPEAFRLFAPRLGLAYRLSDKTVVRTGGGLFYIPATVTFVPLLNPVTYFSNGMKATIDNSITPLNTLSDPYPGGLLQFPGRDPRYQSQLLGSSLNHGYTVGPTLRDQKRGYTYQWNFTMQHQLPGDIAFEAGYSALRGLRLPLNGLQLNQLDPAYFSMGTQLRQQVSNPFFGIIPVGPLSSSTVQLGQLLSPFPQYQGVQDVASSRGDSSYHALQMKAEKRFGGGGTILGSYTLSKILSNVETITPFLDSISGGVAGIQNAFDLRSEKALSSADARQRLVISYVYDLPFGKGKAFASSLSGVADKLISGWGINGVTTFQLGNPLNMSAAVNVTGFNTGLRPNVAANCQKAIDGSAQSKLDQWFNTSCFSQPAPFSFGNESRTDPSLRAHGIANYDLAVFKRTAITERSNLEFRVESFNLFNRVRFGPPNTAFTTAAGSTFGLVTTQVNQPRLIQVALRLQF